MKLKRGDTIGLVAPAGSIEKEVLESAIENLTTMGFKVKVGESVTKKWYSFAGTDEKRAKDINDFFKDKGIEAIMCVRGGYGCTRLLELLDYEEIKKNPKPFIGYSDITSVLLALYKKCGMKSYHGPMGVSNFSGSYDRETLNHFLGVVMEDFKECNLENFGEEIGFYNSLKGEGVLIGGNLAVLVSNLRSEYDIDYRDKILFIEEISESTYKIDRMLWQLKNAGVLNEISGIILGDFKNCEKSSEHDMSLKEVFDFHFANLKKPVCYNLKSGHCKPMLTLEFGGTYRIDGEKGIVKYNN